MKRSSKWKFAAGSLALILLLLAYAYPKSEHFGGSWIGYYRGFGRPDEGSLFSQNYFLLRRDFDDGFGHTDFELSHIGDGNHFRSYYRNGSLSAEGTCRLIAWPDLPCGMKPDEAFIWEAKCYSMDGSLSSEIANGNGAYTAWHPNGQLFMRIEYVNGSLKKSETWDDDGTYLPDRYVENEEIR